MDHPQSRIKSTLSPTVFLFLIFPLALSIATYIYGNDTLFLYINQHFYSSLGDACMPWVTRLGEWIVIIPLILGLSIYNYRTSLSIILSALLTALIVQSLKEFVFNQEIRPASFFANDVSVMHVVPDTDLHSYYSFPSGHTAAAFTWCLSVALYYHNRGLQMLLFLLACVTGWSRIYLAQHFPMDVWAGAFIGIFSAIMIHLGLTKWGRIKYGEGIMTLLRKK